jgi:hypothetical protein
MQISVPVELGTLGGSSKPKQRHIHPLNLSAGREAGSPPCNGQPIDSNCADVILGRKPALERTCAYRLE